ncbi:MAG: hypothetical protein QMB63_01645 [Clostridiaceae bacterium]
MFLIGVINFLFGIFLIQDSLSRIKEGTKLLVFDPYLFGLAKYIPFILAVSVIFASINLLFKLNSSGLLHTYLNSFLFLLLYTPTIVFSKTEDTRFLLLIVVQFLIMLACIVLLYISPDNVRYRKDKKSNSKYDEYKKEMTKYSEKTDIRK